MLSELKECKTLSDFADLIGYSSKTLSYIVYKIPNDQKYKTFYIPKKNGGLREINSPIKPLKRLQRIVVNILAECNKEILGDEYEKNSSPSHGFRKNRSIITNSCNHKNKRYVFNLDLKDFFPSITFARVRGYLIKNRYFELNPNIATLIAQITCSEHGLPQGSPSSPIISDMIANILDNRLLVMARKYRCVYTRYVDDITFSTNNNVFPAQISCMRDGLLIAGNKVSKEIRNSWFEINTGKLRLQSSLQRQVVTGLVTNKKVNVKSEYYRTARAMCDSLFKKNSYYVPVGYHFKGLVKDDVVPKVLSQKKKIARLSGRYVYVYGRVSHLEGVLSFIYQIKHCSVGKERRACCKMSKVNGKTKTYDGFSGIEKLYSRFLFYKLFYALQEPLIVSEGITDPIHLKCALRRLCDDYPKLIKKRYDRYQNSVAFFGYTKKHIDLITKSTGTQGQKKIVESYGDYMKGYSAEKPKYPVIVLVDNDSASKAIKDVLRNKYKIGLYDGPIHVVHNLYVVFMDGFNNEIEDMYDKGVLDTILDEKVFSRENKYDKSVAYGKTEFALGVVKSNVEDIDFNGFRNLLNSISEIIEDYSCA